MAKHTCAPTSGYSASWAGEWYSAEYPPRCATCGRYMRLTEAMEKLGLIADD